MAYEYIETEEGYKQVIMPDPPEKAPSVQATPQLLPQRPMLLQMPFMLQLRQGNSAPFPFIIFFFPRIALLLMQGNMFGQSQRTGLKNITQIIRDSNGYIKEIVEFVK
jgi:hypothetical protein